MAKEKLNGTRIMLIIPETDYEDTENMAIYNGFKNVKSYLKSQLTLALRTYRRKYKNIEEN